MSDLKKKLPHLLRRAFFGESGLLKVQSSLKRWMKEPKTPSEQTTLDGWLSTCKGPSSHPLPEEPDKACSSSKIKIEMEGATYFMPKKRRRKSHYMSQAKGEERIDAWDGSIDNQEKALEDHVSVYGELF